jgi:hypothetical protein
VPQDEPRGMILLQEQMPNIPAPLITERPKQSAPAHAPVAQKPNVSAVPPTPFVPDDPGPQKAEDADVEADRLH